MESMTRRVARGPRVVAIATREVAMQLAGDAAAPLRRLPTGEVLRSFQAPGVVAEWLNAAVLKTAERETVP